MDITLTIQSIGGMWQVALDRDRLTIGPGDEIDIQIDEIGLSSLHCSIHRQGERVAVEQRDHRGVVNRRDVDGLVSGCLCAGCR